MAVTEAERDGEGAAGRAPVALRRLPAARGAVAPFGWSLGARLGWAAGGALLIWLAVLWALG